MNTLKTVVAALGVAGIVILLPTMARADEHHRWHGGEIRHFEHHDRARWQGGYWHHGPHGGRLGWWWVVGGAWYFYPQPIYPYPDPYVPPAVVVPAPSVQPAPQYWYYCDSARTYYPYVSSCPSGWRAVPATPPPQ